MTNLRHSTKLYVMIFAALVAAMASGCASGGFKLTRKYASFVNKQNLIIRIVLYILTSIVFAVTLLIDSVIFNTMDFWEGKVSQGTFNFEKDGMKYAAHHSLDGSGLKNSRIEVFSSENAKLQEVVLKETVSSNIEVYVDGKLRGQVSDISAVPQLTVFNRSGQIKTQQPLWSNVEWLAMK